MGPPQIPAEDLEIVARGLAQGLRQSQIADEQGWTRQRLTRCLGHLRSALVSSSGEADWLDTRKKTPVQVAQEWLRQKSR